jgi:hypothetical protein
LISAGVAVLAEWDDGGAKSGPPASSPSTTPALQCFRTTCKGVDPNAAQCSNVETLASSSRAGMLVEVRYSSRCGTVWGKLTGAQVGDTVEITTSPSQHERATVITNHDKYTPMLPVGQRFSARATAVSVKGDPSRGIPVSLAIDASADQNDISSGHG